MSKSKAAAGAKPWEVDGPPVAARNGPKGAPKRTPKEHREHKAKAKRDAKRGASSAAAAVGYEAPDEDGLNIPEPKRMLFERFVGEYIRDFRATNALQRMGYSYSRALSYVTPWFNHPYVQRRIMERVRELEDGDVVARGQVMAGLLKEANTAPDAATRTRAWAELGKLKGMYIQKVEVKQEVRHTGVMLVPAPQGLDAWSQSAAARQAALKSNATHTTSRQN